MTILRYTASIDTTITNAFMTTEGAKPDGITRATGSNMGASDILEVFSVYGRHSGSVNGTNSGFTSELSRILIKFPIAKIKSDNAVQAEVAAQDPCAFATSCTLPLPKCMEYTVGGFSTRAVEVSSSCT